MFWFYFFMLKQIWRSLFGPFSFLLIASALIKNFENSTVFFKEEKNAFESFWIDFLNNVILVFFLKGRWVDRGLANMSTLHILLSSLNYFNWETKWAAGINKWIVWFHWFYNRNLISNLRKPIYDATHVNVIVLARNKKKLSEI